MNTLVRLAPEDDDLREPELALAVVDLLEVHTEPRRLHGRLDLQSAPRVRARLHVLQGEGGTTGRAEGDLQLGDLVR